MRDQIFKFYRLMVDNLYVKPKCIADLVLNPSKYYNQESYYKDRLRKSNIRIWLDQFKFTVKFGYPNEFYFPYGFDVKNIEEMNKYLHYEEFSRLRDEKTGGRSATAVLRDKFLFGTLTAYCGIRSAENIGVSFPDGVIDLHDKKKIDAQLFFGRHPNDHLFVKPIDGECGSGIFRIRTVDGVLHCEDLTLEKDIMTILKNTRYLIQKEVTQHELMKSLHPESINTIRLVTIRGKNKKIEIFPSILRIGTGGSIVDNTSRGGIAVGIDLNTGRLKEYGFFKPGYGTKITHHPDTKIKFGDFTIPFFEECKEKAIYLHEMLPEIQSIGWDIAIGNEGPIFIEGNDNWEINGPQICNGGLKDNFFARLK